MGERLQFTVRFSDAGDGWVMAQIEEVPGAMTQGRTRAEARANVIDALLLMLKPDERKTTDPDREFLVWSIV